jgi:hypothetical protein
MSKHVFRVTVDYVVKPIVYIPGDFEMEYANKERELAQRLEREEMLESELDYLRLELADYNNEKATLPDKDEWDEHTFYYDSLGRWLRGVMCDDDHIVYDDLDEAQSSVDGRIKMAKAEISKLKRLIRANAFKIQKLKEFLSETEVIWKIIQSSSHKVGSFF